MQGRLPSLSRNRRSEDPGAGHSGSMRLEIQTKNNMTETETISVAKRNPKKKQRPHWRLPKWPQSNDHTKGIQKAAAMSPNAKPIPTIILAIRSRIILPRCYLSSMTRVTAGAFGFFTLICQARPIGRVAGAGVGAESALPFARRPSCAPPRRSRFFDRRRYSFLLGRGL
jgi:hypothetical protein